MATLIMLSIAWLALATIAALLMGLGIGVADAKANASARDEGALLEDSEARDLALINS